MMTELAPDAERATAVLTSHVESGENFEGAIIVGIYPDNREEIWIEFQGVRTNLQCADVNEFCKQIKRAAAIAKAAKP